jgi:hypothetical protein
MISADLGQHDVSISIHEIQALLLVENDQNLLAKRILMTLA